MPRRIFPAGTVTNTTGGTLRLTFYATSATNRRETDLWTVDSSNNLLERIPNGVIIADSTGAYSAFAGPDDIDTLYLNPHTNSGRTAITATGYAGSYSISGPSVGALGLPKFPSWVDPSHVNVITQFQSGHGYTISGADAASTANDTTSGAFVVGTQCATVVSDGAATSAILTNTSVTSFDSTGKSAIVLVKCDDSTHLSSMKLNIGNGGFTNAYEINFGNIGTVASGVWVPVSISLADATVSGSPTRTGITAVRVYFKDDNTGNKVTVHWGGIYFVPTAATAPGSPFPKGVASISFDDSYASTWTRAKPYLDARGIRATAYVIRDYLGTSGRLTLAQLKAMQDQSGWEIAAHSDTSADHVTRFTGLSDTALVTNISAEKSYLLANGMDAQGIAYPGGESNAAVIAQVRKFFRYGMNTVPLCESWPPADPYRIKRFSSISTYSGGYSPASIYTDVTGKIDKAVAEGAWINITFHDVVAHGATLTAATQIDYDDFTAIIDKLVSSGITILPAADVVSSRLGVNFATASPALASATAPTPGVAATPARSDHAHPRYDFGPTDHAWLSWAYDPSAAVNTNILGTAGTAYLVKLHLPVATTITNVLLNVTTAGSTLTSGQCFAGVYQGGTLLGATADQSTAWATSGLKTMALTSPVAAAAGDIYVAFFANGSTLPTLSRAAGQAVINGGLAAAVSRYASADAGLTTSLPSSLGTRTALSVAYWAAIS